MKPKIIKTSYSIGVDFKSVQLHYYQVETVFIGSVYDNGDYHNFRAEDSNVIESYLDVNEFMDMFNTMIKCEYGYFTISIQEVTKDVYNDYKEHFGSLKDIEFIHGLNSMEIKRIDTVKHNNCIKRISVKL